MKTFKYRHWGTLESVLMELMGLEFIEEMSEGPVCHIAIQDEAAGKIEELSKEYAVLCFCKAETAKVREFFEEHRQLLLEFIDQQIEEDYSMTRWSYIGSLSEIDRCRMDAVFSIFTDGPDHTLEDVEAVAVAIVRDAAEKFFKEAVVCLEQAFESSSACAVIEEAVKRFCGEINDKSPDIRLIEDVLHSVLYPLLGETSRRYFQEHRDKYSAGYADADDMSFAIEELKTKLWEQYQKFV